MPNLPACPTGGCLCAWGWCASYSIDSLCLTRETFRIPNHCGIDNIYMNAYRCQVTGASATAKVVGAPVPPVWCEKDSTQCIVGPKQLVAVWQADHNNVVLPAGWQADGTRPSPGYNMKLGFHPGTSRARTSSYPGAEA